MGDFSRFAKKVEKLSTSMKGSLDSEISDEMGLMSLTANRNIAKNRSVASGSLLLRTNHKRIPPKSGDFVTHAVRANKPSAKFVEYGTGYKGEGKFKSPGSTPPIDNILSWIVQKGIQPYAYDTKYELAEAIAQTIEAYGTEPHPFMRPAWREHKANFRQRGSHAISKSVRRL